MPDLLKQIKSFKQDEVLFLGIGDEVLGDDAAGPYFIKHLEQNKDNHNFNYINCGTQMESFFDQISALTPKLIVLVDAANFSEKAGNIKTIDVDTFASASCSTHELPLNVLTTFLRDDISPAPEFMCLGIQAEQLQAGAKITPAVESAIKNFISKIVN